MVSSYRLIKLESIYYKKTLDSFFVIISCTQVEGDQMKGFPLIKNLV